MKIPRNEPCPCLSGKKYKKCCITKELSPIVTQSQDGDRQDHVDSQVITEKCSEVIDLISQDNLDAAKLAISELLAANPEHDYVNFVQGLCLIKSEEFALAVTYFEKAIRLYPLFAEAYYHLGQAYFMQDDLVNTVSCLKKAQAIEVIDSKNPALVEACQEMLASLNDYTKKEFDFNLETHVKFLGLIKRAEACLSAGKYKKAQELYEEVISLDPSCVEAYENLAMIYYRAGKKDQSLECLTQVFVLDPAKMAQYTSQDQSEQVEELDAPVANLLEQQQL